MKMGLLRCVFFINDSNAAEEEEAGGVLCEAVGVVWLDWIWIWYGGKEVVFLRHELRVSFGLVTFVGVEPFFQKQGYVSK